MRAGLRRTAPMLALWLICVAPAAWLPIAVPAADVARTRTVWRWVDEQGVTHYSDTPVAGAEQFEITVSGAKVPQASPTAPASGAPAQEQAERPAAARYERLELVSPAEDASVVNTEGRVELSVRLEPPLAEGDRILIHLDGRPVTRFEGAFPAPVLTGVARGTHRVAVAVTDEKGQALIVSAWRTFHVKQTTAYSPQYPGRPEPPPPPPPWPPAPPPPSPTPRVPPDGT